MGMLGGLPYLIFGIIELLVGLRFVLLLIGANPATTFVAWIYQWSSPFVAPFDGIFGTHNIVAGSGVAVHSVFDWSSLVALVIYGAIAGILSRVLIRTP
jgi:YggT family protein